MTIHEYVRASFLFVNDLNDNHQEKLGSTTMNRHGVVSYDCTTVSGCDQLVVGPTHARGGTLDHVTTADPDQLRVAVVAPIGNSDHVSLSAAISMSQAVPNLCVIGRKFSSNTKLIAIQFAVQYRLCRRNIWFADNPVEVLNEHLSLMVGRCIPTKVSGGRNKDKPWFDDQCSPAFDPCRQEIGGSSSVNS